MIDYVHYCNGPDCKQHSSTTTPPPYAPLGVLTVTQHMPGHVTDTWHFCGWDCLMKFAASFPPVEVVGGA